MWRNYVESREQHTVTGDVLIREGVYSPQLNNNRDVLVYLPPSYGARRYPVIYMHDGQNLFDAVTSFAGEWGVDETLEALSEEGIEAIVVGIPNYGKQRIREYNPFDNRRFGRGRGELYLRFIVETLKPDIDRTFDTLPDRAHTGILGSSMGGLISLYGFLRYPAVFGFVGAMSPAFWIAAQEMTTLIEHSPRLPGKIYLDMGRHEMQRKTGYLPVVPGIAGQLKEKGFNVLYVEDQEGRHLEADWRRRLPDALRFLLT